MPQLKNELAEKELIKKFRHEKSWLSAIPSKQKWVNNDVIKIPTEGIDPTVLINNTSYPITSANAADNYITVSLNKYDTTNETVTDDELYALPYEKVNEVQLKHRLTLEDKTAEHAAFLLAPTADSNDTPILVTTGAVNPATTFKRLTTQDLTNLWAALTKKGVPLKGRMLILSADHAADLMYEDSSRSIHWGGDWQKGEVPVQHCGFELWCAPYTPYYSLVSTTWTKGAFGSTTGRQASVVLYKNNCAKATGTAKRYLTKAEDNPTNRENVIGYRIHFIAVATKVIGNGAIVSGQ